MSRSPKCELKRANEIEVGKVDEFGVLGYVGDRRCRAYVMNEAQLPRFAEDLYNRTLRATGR
jgi:hypothetical protein